MTGIVFPFVIGIGATYLQYESLLVDPAEKLVAAPGRAKIVSRARGA